MQDSYIIRSAVRRPSFQLFSYFLFQIERPNGKIVILFLMVNIKLSLSAIGFLVNWLPASFPLKFLFFFFTLIDNQQVFRAVFK